MIEFYLYFAGIFLIILAVMVVYRRWPDLDILDLKNANGLEPFGYLLILMFWPIILPMLVILIFVLAILAVMWMLVEAVIPKKKTKEEE